MLNDDDDKPLILNSESSSSDDDDDIRHKNNTMNDGDDDDDIRHKNNTMNDGDDDIIVVSDDSNNNNNNNNNDSSKTLRKELSQKFKEVGAIGKDAVLRKGEAWKDRLRDYWASEAPNLVGLLVWGIVNFALSLWAVVHYWEPNHLIAGARFFGVPLNFNCSLLLLSMLRNWITWLRDSSAWASTYLPLDSMPVFHRIVGWAVAVQAFGHVFFHYLNMHDLAETTDERLWTLGWGTEFTAYWTGHVICLIMIFMYLTAVERFRLGNFNTFFSCHHGFILFYCFLFAHAPEFWYYSIGAVVLYCIERLFREIRAKQDRVVEKVIAHPSDVIEIRFQAGKNFRYRPGQYLYLKSPEISRFEWHPFTISSAPEDDYVSVHIRCVGDWTRGLRDLLSPAKEGTVLELNKAVTPSGRPLLQIDGAYGSASDMIMSWKGPVLLVGAGIGVTPFASVIRSLYHRLQGAGKKPKAPRFYFVWSLRNYNAFEWFRDMIIDIEKSLAEQGLSDYLDINIYITGRFDKDSVASLHHNRSLGGDSSTDYQDADSVLGNTEADALTGLSALSNYGRPNFGIIFDRLALAHPASNIATFFCGPRGLGKALQNLTFEKTRTTSCRFTLHKEHF